MSSSLSALERLQSLSLISKVCSILDENLGLSDKTLAEFIINLAEECGGNVDKLHKDLAENGAEL